MSYNSEKKLKYSLKHDITWVLHRGYNEIALSFFILIFLIAFAYYSIKSNVYIFSINLFFSTL